jgi:nitroreductase
MLTKFKNKVRYKFSAIINRTLPKYFYRSGVLSTLYYSVFSKTFRREHQAVLAGKVKHIKSEENYFFLVRNTHRIEKGLTMRPRKDVFAKGYISETIDVFSKVWKNPDFSNFNQMKWFKDVLEEYFNSVKRDEFIDKCHKKFKETLLNNKIGEKNGIISSKPYLRNFQEHTNITYDQFYQLTRQRRSVRWFLDKIVKRELIDKAILAANQSPSACNRQPFQYKIFDSPDLVKHGVQLPMGTVGYESNIPVFIVVVGNLDAYDSERDRHLIYIDASLANMSLMLALETLGLSSCSINWPDIEIREKKMDQFLKLEKHQRPIMCLAIGYPDPTGEVAFSEKRNLEQLRTYNN